MVWTDKKRNTIYAQIPGELVQEKGPLFEQGHMYQICRFKVSDARGSYRPVDGRFMIFITSNTEVKPAAEEAINFPQYIYRLTPFKDLHLFANKNNDFIDVLGIITNVSDIKFTSSGSKLREVFIKDIDDITIKITLWEERALQFSLNDIYSTTENAPIVALFVGCLPKSFRGDPYLSGNTACYWYFNPNIEEAKIYYNRFHSEKIELQLPPPPTDAAPRKEISKLEHRLLCELQHADPYVFLNKEYLCTVTIIEVPKQKWWFPACIKCNKACTPESGGYRCRVCDCQQYKFRYKLTFVASDETTSGNMFCFENAAKRIIGKSCEDVLRSITHSTREDNTIPPEIAAIVSLKFTLAVTITKNSYHDPNRVFQVSSIKESHGRQQALPPLKQKIQEIKPATPNKHVSAIGLQESPSTAMEKLSTSTPAHERMVARTLSFSPTEEDRTLAKGIFDAKHTPIDECSPSSKAIHKGKSLIEDEQELAHDIVGSPPKRARHLDSIAHEAIKSTATSKDSKQG